VANVLGRGKLLFCYIILYIIFILNPRTKTNFWELYLRNLDYFPGTWTIFRELGLFSGNLDYFPGTWTIFRELGLFSGNLDYFQVTLQDEDWTLSKTSLKTSVNKTGDRGFKSRQDASYFGLCM
jgi:hypothetical protein